MFPWIVAGFLIFVVLMLLIGASEIYKRTEHKWVIIGILILIEFCVLSYAWFLFIYS